MMESTGTGFWVQSGPEETAQRGTTLSRESGDMGRVMASGRGMKRVEKALRSWGLQRGKGGRWRT